MRRTPWLWILLCATLAISYAVQGQDFGSLSVAPKAVYLPANPRSYEGFFVVTNYSTDDSADLEIYISDFGLTPTGGFEVLPSGARGGNSLAPYITFEPSTATLGPGASIKVHYSISLPAGDLPPMWGALVVGPIEGTLVNNEVDEGETSMFEVEVKFVHPYAILVHASAETAPETAIMEHAVETAGSAERPVAVSRIVVENTCTDYVCCTYTMELLDSSGNVIASQGPTSTRAILPLETREFREGFSLADLAAGSYVVRVEFNYGADEPLMSSQAIDIGES